MQPEDVWVVQLLEDFQLLDDRVIGCTLSIAELSAPQGVFVHLLDREALSSSDLLSEPDRSEATCAELFVFLVPVDILGLAFLR